MKAQQIHDPTPYEAQSIDGEGENHPLDLLMLYRISYTSVAVHLRSRHTAEINHGRQDAKRWRPGIRIQGRIGKEDWSSPFQRYEYKRQPTCPTRHKPPIREEEVEEGKSC